jgi:histidine triad (HIT) family protein
MAKKRSETTLDSSLENELSPELKKYEENFGIKNTDLGPVECIFCQIIEGKMPAIKVYEDEKVIAILDIHPANPGHVLLLPKEHKTFMYDLDDETIAALSNAVKKLSKALLVAFQAKGTNVFMANGSSAGQRAPHFMIHIIPRREGDGIMLFNLPQEKTPPDKLTNLKQLIEPKIKEEFGIN